MPPGPIAGGTSRRRRVTSLALAAASVALVAAACSSGAVGGGAGRQVAPSGADTRFAQSGPYAAGTARVVMTNGDQLQLWYPVDMPAVQGLVPYTYHLRHWLTDAEATSPALAAMPDAVQTHSYLHAPMAVDTALSGDANDAFPIVLFSHGYASYPEQSSFLTEHLAQWGFVVAAPDHRSRDLAAVLADPTDPSTQAPPSPWPTSRSYAPMWPWPPHRAPHPRPASPD